MKRLLITGGSGLLGLNWACCMRERFDVVLGLHRRPARLPGTRTVTLALENVDVLAAQIETVSPEVIVHTAGLTSVDQCEQQPDLAELANTVLAENVAVAAHRSGARFIHVSTDHLFSGERPMVSESEPPQPLNAYARTKLLAEQRVARVHPEALIVRTNFFGWGHAYRRSFSDWIIGSLRAGHGITMFDDVFFTPILIDDLAATVHEILEWGGQGIYHVVGEERVSKYGFAQRLAKHFVLDWSRVTRGRICQSALSAKRPMDMSLDNTKAREFLNRKIGSLDSFLTRLLLQEQDGRHTELIQAVAES